MKISVVVPVYNESLGIEEFMKTLQATMDSLTIGWDVLFVDDGSDDDSWQIIERLTRLHPVVRGGIQLLRNFGHQIALSAGLEHADGDAVITMDADLQHPPQWIPTLVAQWQEGWEVVNTVRADTRTTGWFKRRSSTLFYRFLNKISNVPSYRLVLGIILYVASFVTWLLIIRYAPVVIAYPLSIGLIQLFLMVGSHLVLHSRVTSVTIVGSVLVLAGVILLSMGTA